MSVEFMEEEEMTEMPVMNVIPRVNNVTGWCGKKCEVTLPFLCEEECDFAGQFDVRGVGSCPEEALKGTVLEYRQEDWIAEEGYVVEILPEKILITSKTATGKYYGMQTLTALIEEKNGILDCMKIEDAPRYGYRGFMIDVSRHFFSIEEIKKIIDRCAKYKLNKFHWHLSDDQGYRIESKRFPKLNQIGSVRKEEDGTITGGFYTQQEIRDVVAYAAERQMEVIPEIDLPGHTSAIIASYPELSCSGKAAEVKNKGGIYPQILCAGKESVMQFLYELLDEVVPLFPGKYFHIGGDEAPKEEWEKCDHCQKLIRREKLNSEEELQAYFTSKLVDYLTLKGKTVIGWNDVLISGKVKNVIVQYWMESGSGYSYKEVEKGQKFLLSNFNAFYMDYPYGMVTLRGTYSFEPNIQGNTAIPVEQVLGLEAPVWTEQIATEQKLEKQIFPRIQALAENAWSREKDYEDFLRRVKLQETFFAAAGIACTPVEDANLSAEKGIRQILDWLEIMIQTHMAIASEITQETVQEYARMGSDLIDQCMQDVYTRDEQEEACALFLAWLEQETSGQSI